MIPMPIIVGAPRSGTTLLRFMLDAHPDVAIPPDRKSKPLRVLIVVLVGLTVGFVMILWVLIKEWTERAPPQERVKLRILESFLRVRRDRREKAP